MSANRWSDMRGVRSDDDHKDDTNDTDTQTIQRLTKGSSQNSGSLKKRKSFVPGSDTLPLSEYGTNFLKTVDDQIVKNC